jgi:hypothetical protein
VDEVPVLVVDLQQALKLSGDAGAVHENVDSSQSLDYTRDGIWNPAGVRQVSHKGEHIAAGLFALIDDGVHSALIAVKHGDGSAGAKQSCNRRTADSRCASGHDRHFA